MAKVVFPDPRTTIPLNYWNNPDNGVIYDYDGSYPSGHWAARRAYSGGDLFVDGSGSFTSNLEVEGSSDFAGDVTVGPNDTNFAIPGHRISFDPTNGQIIARAKAGAASFAAITETGANENFPAYVVYNNLGQVVGRWKKNGEFAIYDGTLGTEEIVLNTDGSATFAGGSTVAGGTQIRIGSGQAAVATNDGFGTATLAGSTLVLQNASGTNTVNILSETGSATFAGDVIAGTINAGSNSTAGSFTYASGGISTQVPSTFTATSAIYTGYYGTSNTFNVSANGSATFAGTVTANGSVLTRNVEFQLEADDDTKYTSTTDSEGNLNLVYNGATLDVKDRLTKADTALQSLKTAVSNAADFAELKTAMIAALSDI